MKSTYNELFAKFSLPVWEELEREFEIEEADKPNLTLREIRRKMVEKISKHAKSIESILHPDGDLCSLYECQNVTDENKSKLFNVLKQLKALELHSAEVSVKNLDEKNAEFINSAFETWNLLANEIENFYKELKAGWQREDAEQAIQEYFG